MKSLWKYAGGLALMAAATVMLWTPSAPVKAASHREAPLIAMDPEADITDWFAFVSYDNPSKVTMIMNTYPFEEPSLGPNYFNFGDDVLYTFKVDNNADAVEDLSFEFRFTTTFRAPGVFLGLIGAGNGIPAPAGSASPIAPGSPLIPNAITALDGPGSEGLNYRQSYTVTMVKNGVRTLLNTTPLYAVPSNSGPRTIPNYDALAAQGIYNLGNGIKVFAGQRDDGFYIDLGGTFDTLNYRRAAPVLTAAEDANDKVNGFGIDHVAGFNVQSIALEVPITMLTRTGALPTGTSDPVATIGTWGTTARQLVTVRPTVGKPVAFGNFKQIQRMGNPLINEVLVGIADKDAWSQDVPTNDGNYAKYFLDPLLARAIQAAYGVNVPPPPRTDLLPLLQYPGIIPATGATAGPVADLLRLNVAVPPTAAASRKRLGPLAGDLAGWPNGRRVSDDVTDVALRAVVGVLAGPTYNVAPNNLVGDGVNTNDKPYLETFPYQASPASGRDRVHQ